MTDGKKTDLRAAFGLTLLLFVFIVLGIVLGFNFGEHTGYNKGKSMACQINTTYVPPMYCYEITHNSDGYRCCNWRNTTLSCGRPLLQIR